MSQKERDRLTVMGQLARGELTQTKAAELLGLCTRQVRRIFGRYAAQGDEGLIHLSRGKPSNRRVPDEVRDKAAECLESQEWRGFGPTIAAEMLAEHEGIHVSRETLRRWMMEESLWKPKQRRVTHQQWRKRKECFGEMVQMDTSEHDWFEGRGEQAVLISMVDDATSQLLACFFASDSTESNMTMLGHYIGRHGRPQAIYADKASHFVTTRSPCVEEQLEGKPALTQIGRALEELDIEFIPAHSPQAKGRVERVFGTLQDRLVKAMRLAGIATIQAANEFLEESFLPRHNARFAVEPACAADAHRPLGDHDLEAILSHQESRVVANDYTIQYYGLRYQILRTSIRAGLRRSKVVVERRLDGSIEVRYRDQYLECEPVADRPRRKQDEAQVRPRSKRAHGHREGHKPAEDHPWRKSYKGTRNRGVSPGR